MCLTLKTLEILHVQAAALLPQSDANIRQLLAGGLLSNGTLLQYRADASVGTGGGGGSATAAAGAAAEAANSRDGAVQTGQSARLGPVLASAKVDAAAGGLRCRRCLAVVSAARFERHCAAAAASGAPLVRIIERGRAGSRRTLQVSSPCNVSRWAATCCGVGVCRQQNLLLGVHASACLSTIDTAIACQTHFLRLERSLLQEMLQELQTRSSGAAQPAAAPAPAAEAASQEQKRQQPAVAEPLAAAGDAAAALGKAPTRQKAPSNASGSGAGVPPPATPETTSPEVLPLSSPDRWEVT